MTTKEMMIGDFYRVNRDGICIPKGSIVEVRAIDADNKLEEKGLVGSAYCHPLDEERFEFDGGIWCDFLDPIPLTPEILEKNGFKSWEHGYAWKERIGMRGQTTSASSPIEVIIYEGGHSVIMNPHEGKEFQGSIDNVHELQNVLRLCRIEKNIEL